VSLSGRASAQDTMSVLPPHLSSRLRCPACLEGAWVEHRPEGSAELASIECGSCGARYLVVEEIPLLGVPLSHGGAASEHDPDVKHALRLALGRYFDLFGGLREVIAFVNEQPLEAAFRVPGSEWISLDRFGAFPKYRVVPALVGAAETVVDLGCGYGCSTVPFLETARCTIGIDENLLLLLLLRRYARERAPGVLGLICYDLERLRLPFADSGAEVLVGLSFFNHYACLQTLGFLERFFAEAARVLRPRGRLLLDMVPNPKYRFLWEINFGPFDEGVARRLLERPLRRLPLRRVPGPLLAGVLWSAHSLYQIAGRRRPLTYRSFRREVVSKALPEIGSRVLPADAHGYRRLAPAFSQIELADEEATLRTGALVELSGGTSSEKSYVLLHCTR
jgi:SAM-dependent methyltransferase